MSQFLKCRFCGKSTEVLPSRRDPPNLFVTLTRCGACYPTHPEPIVLEYFDIDNNKIEVPEDF